MDPLDVPRAYDLIAPKFFAERSTVFRETKYLDLALTRVPMGAAILDLGCGTGRPIAEDLIRRGYDVTGVDGSAQMLAIARRNLPGAQLILLLAVGCSKTEPATTSFAPRSVEAFKQIGASTSFRDVERRFGPPDSDIGSGLFIYVYRLPDGSDVKIGASDPNKILYVRHGTNSLFEAPSQ